MSHSHFMGLCSHSHVKFCGHHHMSRSQYAGLCSHSHMSHDWSSHCQSHKDNSNDSQAVVHCMAAVPQTQIKQMGEKIRRGSVSAVLYEMVTCTVSR